MPIKPRPVKPQGLTAAGFGGSRADVSSLEDCRNRAQDNIAIVGKAGGLVVGEQDRCMRKGLQISGLQKTIQLPSPKVEKEME